MKAKWILLFTCLVVLLSACVQEPAQTTVPTAESTYQTEPLTERIYTLADLDFGKMHYSGGTPEGYYPFLYKGDQKDRTLELVLEKDAEEVAQLLKDFTPGYVYLLDRNTQEFHCIIAEPILAKHDTSDYLFYITADNTLIVTDMTGMVRVELYQAKEPLGMKSLAYWRTSLYFIEGSSIMNMDLITGEVKKLFEYEGAIDADPLYGIHEEFPHLMLIMTETEGVACNLETGETVIIPETGQWGTAAFYQYVYYGIWPEKTEPPTEEPTEPPALQDGQRLMEAELEAFELLFAPVATPYAMQPVNYYGMALCVDFDAPENLNLITYFNRGLKSENMEPITEEERAYYLQKTGEERIFGDLFRLPAWQVNGILMYYFGLTAEDVTDWSSPGWVYNPNTDCYYLVPPGTLAHGSVDFYDGYYNELDGTLSLYYKNRVERDRDYVITLLSKKSAGDTGYYILSNLPVAE